MKKIKKFKCKGLRERATTGWSSMFKPGDIYDAPPQSKKAAAKFPALMVLEHRPGRPIVVDADQFVEVFENESENGILKNTVSVAGLVKRPKVRSFRFMCRGTRELRFKEWGHAFGAGRIYSSPEWFHEIGNFGGLGLDNGKSVFIVDADQFIEID
jgi:hypothetical protein